MLERVIAVIPKARDRIRVRFHPITIRYPRRAFSGCPFFLYPSLPAAHKDLVGNLSFLLNAMRFADSPMQVRVTATEEHLGGLDRDSRVVALGPQTLGDMDRLLAEACALYAPTEVESFGYPVAEARAIGLPVLAIDSARNREIAGDALVGYSPKDSASLVNAIDMAATLDVMPDPAPFDPDSYFTWLTSTSVARRG
jgi:glycosyltransferase involved in cell wall biosynthesis